MKLVPLHDKVMGRMVDHWGGKRRTQGGVIIAETTDENDLRARWFIITHVGPEQKDVKVGEYALLPHGRWSQGIDVDGTRREEDKLFVIDHDSILGTQIDEPDLKMY